MSPPRSWAHELEPFCLQVAITDHAESVLRPAFHHTVPARVHPSSVPHNLAQALTQLSTLGVQVRKLLDRGPPGQWRIRAIGNPPSEC